MAVVELGEAVRRRVTPRADDRRSSEADGSSARLTLEARRVRTRRRPRPTALQAPAVDASLRRAAIAPAGSNSTCHGRSPGMLQDSQLESNLPGTDTCLAAGRPSAVRSDRRQRRAVRRARPRCASARGSCGDSRQSRSDRALRPSPRHPADGRFGTPARRALQRGSVFSSRSGMTLTATSMLCPRPPRITPRSGTTSAKSAPQASVM